jgi:hypothetical protein
MTPEQRHKSLVWAEEIFAEVAEVRLERHGITPALQDAIRALFGPPPTQDELAEARSRIAAQAARDRGQSGLF